MLMTVCIAVGFILDLIFGDPYALPHPIIYIGKLISFCDKHFYSKKRAFFRGMLMTTLVCAVSFAVSAAVLYLCGQVSVYLAAAVETFWIFQILACRSLCTESMKVYHALKNEGIDSAREKLSYIVGRDTKSLSEEEIIAATVETVAENTTDGVTAPFVYMAIGGAPLGFLYKAVNTLDSMVGYRTERYELFGRASARLDDAANFIPSRICALLMIASCGINGLDMRGAWRIFKRDRLNHLSPNSAQTESVIAGALGIQLGGTHDYFGTPVEKPTIGDKHRVLDCEDIKTVNKVMITTAVLSAALVCAVRVCVMGVILWL